MAPSGAIFSTESVFNWYNTVSMLFNIALPTVFFNNLFKIIYIREVLNNGIQYNKIKFLISYPNKLIRIGIGAQKKLSIFSCMFFGKQGV